MKDENDNTRDNLIALINVEINALNDKLLCIETENRTITKEDCCIARVLILYLAIRYSLIRNKDENVTYANYVGEISLRDGDLNLKEETEKKLFSLVRTGLLGAILVGEDLRHVFFYRKDGVKKGRKYCASTITCTNNEDKGETVNQVLNVCLFTVEVPNTNAIPGYVFDSIQNREKLIKEVLERKENGDK